MNQLYPTKCQSRNNRQRSIQKICMTKIQKKTKNKLKIIFMHEITWLTITDFFASLSLSLDFHLPSANLANLFPMYCFNGKIYRSVNICCCLEQVEKKMICTFYK